MVSEMGHPAMHMDTLCQLVPDAKVRVENDGAFLLYGSNQNPFLVNHTASKIINFIRQQGSVRDILAHMSDQYPSVPPSRLANDILGTLAELVKERYVITASPEEVKTGAACP